MFFFTKQACGEKDMYTCFELLSKYEAGRVDQEIMECIFFLHMSYCIDQVEFTKVGSQDCEPVAVKFVLCTRVHFRKYFVLGTLHLFWYLHFRR